MSQTKSQTRPHPEHRLSPFIVAVGRHLEHGGEVLLLRDGGRAQGWLEPRGWTPGHGGGSSLIGGHRSLILVEIGGSCQDPDSKS